MITRISLSITTHSYKLFPLWWDVLRSVLLATFRYTYRIINYCYMLYITFPALRAFLKPKYNHAHPPSTSDMGLSFTYNFRLSLQLHFYLCLITYSVYSTYQPVSLILKDKTKIKVSHGLLCVFPSITDFWKNRLQ